MHASDFVRAGEALVDGPLVPHDILRISGEEAVQHYLVREIQNVYRSQRVDIDDKHIEIIVAQMLRKVRIESVGDTGLLPGSVMDRFEFRGVNQNLTGCVKITEKGDSDFAPGSIVPKDALEQVNAQIEALGGDSVQGDAPQGCHGQHAVARHHEGSRAKCQLHFRRQLPGNDQGAHRSGLGRQGRSPGRFEGKRDPRSPGAGRHRFPHISRVGGSHPARRRRGFGRRKGSYPDPQLPTLERGEEGNRGLPAAEWRPEKDTAPSASATSLDALLGGRRGADPDAEAPIRGLICARVGLP